MADHQDDSGSAALEELDAALFRIAPTPPGGLAEMMSADERGIARTPAHRSDCSRCRGPAGDRPARRVVYVDRHRSSDPVHRRADQALREPRSPSWVAATIRADFWDRPLGHPALASMLEQAAVTVGPMTPDELEPGHCGSRRNHGVEFAPGLIARMIADTSDQPGALPLLQYTLTDLFASNATA